MKGLRWLSLVAVVALVASLLGGCFFKQDLIMGTEATFAPFEFTDEKNNIIGFDIDIAQYIAKEMGRKLVIKDMPFKSLTGALNAKQIDFIIAGMTITADRQEEANFSEPYYNASQVIVILGDDNRNITVPEDLADLVIAVQMGTTGAFEAEAIKGDENDPSIKQFDKVNEAFMELKNGRADAVIIDKPVAERYIQVLGGMKIVGEPFTNEQFGIAVRKEDQALLEAINRALTKLKDSGEYDRIFAKWFDTDK